MPARGMVSTLGKLRMKPGAFKQAWKNRQVGVLGRGPFLKKPDTIAQLV